MLKFYETKGTRVLFGISFYFLKYIMHQINTVLSDKKSLYEVGMYVVKEFAESECTLLFNFEF